MNLHWIDWLIVGIVISGMISLATYTKRYVHGVADFLAADRMAGKYLLTVSGTWTGTIGMVGALPDYFNILGTEISSFPAIMILYLTLAVYIACTGGQISIMLADFAQETFSKMILVIMICYLMCSFNWDDIMTGPQFAPEVKSMINPFKSGGKDSP